MPAMTAERSLQLEVIAFISSEKPVLSIVKDKRTLHLPLTSRPVAEKESLETSTPTNSLLIVAPPVKSYSDKAGEASRPILHDDKGSKTQSTYYGFGRQGTDSL